MYFAADRSFVLLQALKSCINGHRFQASLTPMSHCVQLHEAINVAIKTLQSLGDLDAQAKKAVNLIEDCLRAGNKLLICLTTSGKSKNIARALEEARARKLKTITLLGRDGGSTIGMADVDLVVKSDSTARIQEAHQLLLHVLCEIIESQL